MDEILSRTPAEFFYHYHHIKYSTSMMLQETNLPDVRSVVWLITNIELQLVNKKKDDMMEYVTWGQ